MDNRVLFYGKMKMIFILMIFAFYLECEALTRYACMTSLMGRGMAMMSSEETNLGRSMSGSLSCTEKKNSKILVTRIIHGFGNFQGCANPDQSCDKEIYSDTAVASYCDGKVTCFVETIPTWLDKCSMMSDFVHIEYECIFDTSIFDVCRETSTFIADTSVFVVSPNVFQSTNNRTGMWPTCECILNSRFSDQIMTDYIHSDVYADGNRCSGSYVLIESKLLPNQTTVDKEVEVCGRRSVSNQLFRGSVRLTYHNRRGSTDDGFLTKFRVPLSNGAEIHIQCGTVKSPGEDSVHQGPPPPREPGFISFRSNSAAGPGNIQPIWGQLYNNPVMPFSRSIVPPWTAPVPPFFLPYPQIQNGGQSNPRNNPSRGTNNNPNLPWDNLGSSSNSPWPDPSVHVQRDPRRFASQKMVLPTTNQLGIATRATPVDNRQSSRIDPRLMSNNADKSDSKTVFIPWTNPKKKTQKFIPWSSSNNKQNSASTQTTKSPKLPASLKFIGTKQGGKSNSPLPLQEHTSEEVPQLVRVRKKNSVSEQGDTVAYIIGGSGGGLIVFCCLSIFFLYTRRRRSFEAMKRATGEVERRNNAISEDPTYALPADVSLRLPIPSHDNAAYVDDNQSNETEKTQCEHVILENKKQEAEEIFIVVTQATQTNHDTDHSTSSVYDNNFLNERL